MGPNVCEVGILTQVVDGPSEGIEEGKRMRKRNEIPPPVRPVGFQGLHNIFSVLRCGSGRDSRLVVFCQIEVRW